MAVGRPQSMQRVSPGWARPRHSERTRDSPGSARPTELTDRPGEFALRIGDPGCQVRHGRSKSGGT